MSSNRVSAKSILLPGLLGLTIMLASCQPINDVVVMNKSDDRIQVQFVMKKPEGLQQVELPPKLGVKLVSEVAERAMAWRDLQTSQITFDAGTRTAVVTLMPKEALRLAANQGKCDDPLEAEFFSIEEISVTGPTGAIRLQGRLARTGFSQGPTGICALSYR